MIRTAVRALSVVVAMWALPLTAQQAPMEWGEIPAEHLAMESYSGDPSAPGVVLGFVGEVEIRRRDFSMVLDVHRRVKIFSEAAYETYEEGTVEITYRHPNRFERLRRLEGQTFVPDGQGGYERVELRSSDIYEEREGNFTTVRFTMPALQPGAIFEFRYRLFRARSLIIPDWRFQGRLPVLWSEYRARFPANITLIHHLRGDPEFSFQPGDELPPDAPRRWRDMHRWVMEDIPAIRDEEFVASFRNHAYGIRFEVSAFDDHQFAPSWAEIDEWLLGSDFFGGRLRLPDSMVDQVEELVRGARTDDEKMHRIYDYVRENLDWNGYYRRFAARPADEVLERGRGTSAEINLLLVAMLREARLPAHPVIVSTRRHGEVVRWFISERQFNHVLASVTLDGEQHLLDATDPHRPIGMLPVAALNGYGRLVRSWQGSQWVALEPPRSSIDIEIEGEIGPDGRLSGVMTGTFEGYPALGMRQRLAELEEEEDEPDLDDRGQAVVDSDELRFTGVAIDGLDYDGEVSFDLEFEAMEAGEVIGHLLTIDPVLIGRSERNPFPDEERTYPVDFAYPLSATYTARFTLPDGFELDELPQHVRLSTDDGGLAYGRVITFAGETLQVRRIYSRRNAVFHPREYASLREVYEGMTAADAAMVVLVRSALDEVESAAGDED